MDESVLLIEDDPITGTLLASRMNKEFGIQVKYCPSGEEAVNLLRQKSHTYKVVLLDWVLNPPESGPEILKQLRAIDPHMPVAAITGKMTDGGIDVYQQGADLYFYKPIDFVGMALTIRELIAQDGVFHKIAVTTARVIETEQVLVWRYDRTTSNLCLSGWAKSLVKNTTRIEILNFPVDPQRLGWLGQDEPKVFGHFNPVDEYPAAQMALEQGWKSAVMFPLRQREDLFGLVQIFFEAGDQKSKLNSPVFSLLTILMQQFADTIYHTTQTLKSQELLNFGKSLTEKLDLKSVEGIVLTKGQKLLDADAGALYLCDVKRNCYVLQDQRGSLNLSLPNDFKIENIENSETEIQTLINRLEKTANGCGSIYAVPLCSPRMNIGLLVFARCQAVIFSESERKLVRDLADIATPIIDLARVTNFAAKIDEAVWNGRIELQEAIVEAAYELTARSVCLWVMEDNKKALTVKAYRNISKSFINEARIEISDKTDSLIHEAFVSKKPVQVIDVQASDVKDRVQLFKLAKRENLRATLVVPIFDTEGQPVGAITLHDSSPRPFSSYEENSLAGFAAQIGADFGFYERQRQLERLIQAGKRTIYGDITGTTIVDEIAEEARKITGADIVSIYPYDPYQDDVFDVNVVGMAGIPAKMRKAVNPKTRTLGISSLIRYLGKLVVYDDLTPDYAPVNYRLFPADESIDPENLERILVEQSELKGRFIERNKIRSFVGITMREEPVEVGQRAKEVGVLYINFLAPHHFTTSEINIIELLAQQIAGQIRTARLYGNRQVQINVLQNVLSAIGSEIDPLPVIMRETARLFGADFGGIYLHDRANSRLKVVALWDDKSLKQGMEIPEDKKSNDSNKGICGLVARTGETCLVADTRQSADYKEWNPTTRSEMAVAIKDTKGNVFGVLNLEKNAISGFNQADKLLAERLAMLMYSVIEKSSLLDKTQKLTKQLALIHQIVEQQNIEDILDRIIQGLCEIMGPQSTASINLYETDDDQFHSILSKGQLAEEVKIDPRPAGKNGIARYVVSRKEAYYLERADQPQDPCGPTIRPEMVRLGVRSMAGLPLIRRGQVLGVLFVHLMHDHSYDQQTRSILTTFASQAAIAVDTARKFFDFDKMREIYTAILTQPLDLLPTTIVKNAVEILPGQFCELWLKDEPSGDLVLRAVQAPEGTQVALGTRLKPGEKSMNRWVLERGQPERIDDLSHPGMDYLRHYENAQSALVVPVIAFNKVIGTINIESDRLNSYTVNHIKQLSDFAYAAAVLFTRQRYQDELERRNAELTQLNAHLDLANAELTRINANLDRTNSRLYRKIDTLKAIYKIGQELTSGIQLSELEILSIIHKQASHIIDTDNMFIALCDEKAELIWFEIAFLDGQPVDLDNTPGWQPRRGGNGRTEWIIRNKKPILTYTSEEAKTWYTNPENKEYIGQAFASWVGVPMLFGERVYGVIATYNKSKEFQYDPDDIDLLKEISGLAAIALENARLVQRLDMRIRELDSLRKLSEDLNLSLQN